MREHCKLMYILTTSILYDELTSVRCISSRSAMHRSRHGPRGELCADEKESGRESKVSTVDPSTNTRNRHDSKMQ